MEVENEENNSEVLEKSSQQDQDFINQTIHEYRPSNALLNSHFSDLKEITNDWEEISNDARKGKIIVADDAPINI